MGVGLSLRADRWRTLGVFGLSLLRPLVGVLTALFLKRIVDAAAVGDAGGALGGAAAIAGVVAGGMLASTAVTRMLFPLKEHTGLALDERLIDLVGGAATIEHHERPAYLARIGVLRREGHILAASGLTTAGGIEVVIEAAATGLLLAWVNPALLALPVFALPSLWAGARTERLRQDALEATVPHARRARDLFALATSVEPAKELRIYGVGQAVLDRHRATWEVADAALDRAAVRGLAWSALGWVTFAAGYAGAVLLVARDALAGRATVGDVVLAITIAAQVNEQVAGAVRSVTDLARTVTVASRFVWLVDYARGPERSRAEPELVPDHLTTGIELRGVRFRYPSADADTLTGIDLTLPAGATVAVVGENGAGKSTLVKLLAGLYEPSEGSVLVDGIDLRAFDVADWRRRMSAGFQDFTRFELLAAETVGVGDLERLDDRRAVSEAVGRAGSQDVVDALPRGLDTPLGPSFEDGEELSGGQWQKLALARAMMRTGPLLLVLDEPTAALDPDTEHAVFVRYSQAASAAAAEHGAVTLLVSHRFSTVHMADLIVVLEGGRVVECGNHAQLLAVGGLYAELYELQARAYR